MQQYNKDEIKNKVSLDMTFDIVYEFGGDPQLTDFGFISRTICHNAPGEGSHKLYYYENTKLFRCYTGCDSYFDIFELIKKVQELKNTRTEWGLYDSVRWVAARYGWSPEEIQDVSDEKLEDWTVIGRYDRLQDPKEILKDLTLKVYDDTILKNLAYPHIAHWEKEGITREVALYNHIGYCPSTEQITIPHYDINGNFIGLRGRALGQEEAQLYGKYRPLIVGGQQYNHPLGLNLYNLNHSKDNIRTIGKAIIFEGEKSTLLYQSYFGIENDISTACCGSSVSATQIQLLIDSGAKEIIIAFDKQFQKIGDSEWQHLTKNLKTIHSKFNKYVTISFLFDKEEKLNYKDSPIDQGKETFLYLFKNRIFL